MIGEETCVSEIRTAGIQKNAVLTDVRRIVSLVNPPINMVCNVQHITERGGKTLKKWIMTAS